MTTLQMVVVESTTPNTKTDIAYNLGQSNHFIRAFRVACSRRA